jgi:hypothetical protein
MTKTMKTQLKCKENLRLGILVPAIFNSDMDQADVRLVASGGVSFRAHKVNLFLYFFMYRRYGTGTGIVTGTDS